MTTSSCPPASSPRCFAANSLRLCGKPSPRESWVFVGGCGSFASAEPSRLSCPKPQPPAQPNQLTAVGTVPPAAGGCASSSASPRRSSGSVHRRFPSPPPDASTRSSSTTPVASARSAFLRLDNLRWRFPLAAAAPSGAKLLTSPCHHRSPSGCPAPLSPSNG